MRETSDNDVVIALFICAAICFLGVLVAACLW